MRINELLSNNSHIDEGVGAFLGKTASAVGGAVGGVQGAWKGMKDVYGQKRDRVSAVAQRNVQRGGGYRRPTVAASPGGTIPTSTTAGIPATTPSDLDDPKKLRAQAAELTQKANEIEKQQTAAPQGQALDLDQLKKDREAKQAAGQAGQQQAQQQMAATQQTNAAANQQDAEIKAAADAAKAKPAFQQTAADKLAIKAAADKGIREEEIAEGFHSNFLGMML